MRAIDKTTQLFVASVKDAFPDVNLQVARSKNAFGRSNYVYIHLPAATRKVRISDHAIGMRRALSGSESLFIGAGATPDRWAVWLGALRKSVGVSV